MLVSYHPAYVIPMPPRHSFPMNKFEILRDILLRDQIISPTDIIPMDECSWDTLALVHTDRFLHALRTGTMTDKEVRRMGLPWSEHLVERSRRAVQGTINAFQHALTPPPGKPKLSGNLAGGTHHAQPDFAQGFCVLNDVAIAIRHLQQLNKISTALVIDLDVHQGDGTATIFEHDPRVYTFSMHGEKNFPLRKQRSTRDVPLPDDMPDADYLATLKEHLTAALNESALLHRDNGTQGLDIAIYVQGVDVCLSDKFGRLNISRNAMNQRDQLVINSLLTRNIPTVLTLGGGYALPPLPQGTTRRSSPDHTLTSPALTADLHADMYRTAVHLLQQHSRDTVDNHNPAAARTS